MSRNGVWEGGIRSHWLLGGRGKGLFGGKPAHGVELEALGFAFFCVPLEISIMVSVKLDADLSGNAFS